MKVRESGMPEEVYWESLFDIPLILDRLRINAALKDVVEFGCGYGTFTLPVALIVNGMVDTFDIDPQMITRTGERMRESDIHNIKLHLRDVLSNGFGLPDASRDAVMLFNILHTDDPVKLLTEAARVLRPGGLVQIIHWRHDPNTPRGPNMNIRPRPEQIRTWACETNQLDCAREPIDLPPWHYGWICERF